MHGIQNLGWTGLNNWTGVDRWTNWTGRQTFFLQRFSEIFSHLPSPMISIYNWSEITYGHGQSEHKVLVKRTHILSQ